MRRNRWALLGAALLIAAGAAGGATVLVRSGAQRATTAAAGPPPNTARVERGSLSAVVALQGTLTYRARPDGSPDAVISPTSGTVTWLPEVGQVVEHGRAICRVDGDPLVLLYGSTPVYRGLSPGMAGADVAALNAELVALGYATAADLPPGADTFTTATASALQRLQASLGLPQTGTLPLGQAVFAPGAVRVTGVAATLGGPLRAGEPVVQGTSTTRVVTIALDAARQSEIKVGDRVVITLPDTRTTPGVVAAVGTVANLPPPASGGGGGRGAPTVSVEVRPTDPAATGGLDQAPVRVSITTAVAEGALSVPVTALVGKSGGGFAVEIVRPDGQRALVAVTLGLFDSAGGRVQVEGELREGDRVVVPSS